MSHPWALSFLGLPAFLSYFGSAMLLLLLFGFIYTRLTAHDEFELIRHGKSAAAVALGGSLLAFALPLCCVKRGQTQSHHWRIRMSGTWLNPRFRTRWPRSRAPS